MIRTAWQDAEVARKFLEERRGAIPYAADQLEMLLHLVRHFRPQPRLLIDLGCGDGLLARVLLSAYPETAAILVDHSPPMLERARAAMVEYAGRCDIRAADLAAPISGLAEAGSVDLVVSGFAIHHLPDARKRELYGEIYDLLAPGGPFVNVEHVSSASRELEALFDQQYIDQVTARTGKPREIVGREYFGRPDKADNILASLETQLGWLRELGFRHVDCPFKWLELAVFCGVR